MLEPQRRDKGKPAVRRGRKAMDLSRACSTEAAGLPNGAGGQQLQAMAKIVH